MPALPGRMFFPSLSKGSVDETKINKKKKLGKLTIAEEKMPGRISNDEFLISNQNSTVTESGAWSAIRSTLVPIPRISRIEIKKSKQIINLGETKGWFSVFKRITATTKRG